MNQKQCCSRSCSLLFSAIQWPFHLCQSLPRPSDERSRRPQTMTTKAPSKAATKQTSAIGELVIQFFAPLSTKWSPWLEFNASGKRDESSSHKSQFLQAAALTLSCARVVMPLGSEPWTNLKAKQLRTCWQRVKHPSGRVQRVLQKKASDEPGGKPFSIPPFAAFW